MMSTKTLRHELTNFLTPRLSPEVMMEFNGWLHSRPDLQSWLDLPEHRRVAILEVEGITSARTALNSGGPRW